MSDLSSFTLGGFFVAGLATTLHCAGMCGLLTCGLGIAGRGPALASVGVYHFARLVGYGLAGAVMGFVGGSFGLQAHLGGVSWLPLLLILFLVAIAFGLEKKIATFPGLGRAALALRTRTLKSPPLVRAAFVGVATPLLPCGPLYAILALALASGSMVRGAEVMLAFGLGAVPGIWFVQIGSAWMNRRLSAKGLQLAKRGLAAAAAVSLLWHFSYLPGGTGQGIAEGTQCRCEGVIP